MEGMEWNEWNGMNGMECERTRIVDVWQWNGMRTDTNSGRVAMVVTCGNGMVVDVWQ
jgi:hypothetical protein